MKILLKKMIHTPEGDSGNKIRLFRAYQDNESKNNSHKKKIPNIEKKKKQKGDMSR